MAGSNNVWGCPHDVEGICQRVLGAKCDPGMRGCELEGKVRFARDEMNLPRAPQKAAKSSASKAPERPKRRLPF